MSLSVNRSQKLFDSIQNSQIRASGKKCDPYRQFGISKQAPLQFCLKNSLICNNFNSLRKSQTKEHKPQSFSQKNFFSISQSRRQNQIDFNKKYNESYQKNKAAFHRISSEMTLFYDKNAWIRNSKQQQNKKTQNKLNQNHLKSSQLYKSKISRQRTRIFSNSKLNNEQIIQRYSKLQEVTRPKTSMSTCNIRFKIDVQKKLKQDQFKVKVPNWCQNQYNVKYLQWKP